jgi:hypothetical protein
MVFEAIRFCAHTEQHEEKRNAEPAKPVEARPKARFSLPHVSDDLLRHPEVPGQPLIMSLLQEHLSIAHLD